MSNFLNDIWETVKETGKSVVDMTLEEYNARIQQDRILEMLKFERSVSQGSNSPDGQVQTTPSNAVQWTNPNLFQVSPLMVALIAGGGLLVLTRK